MTKGANPTVTLTHDASGNLTSDSVWSFAFDAENKLVSATKSGTAASYAYDPLLRRQSKTVNGVTTTFLLDGSEEIGDYDGNGGLLRRYVPSNDTDAPIAMIEGTGTNTVRKWFHRNRIGSTIAMSDANGLVSEGPITYDAFGNSASVAGVPFKYTGRRLDPETGLYYYRARYYSPALGRFLQTDPIGSCDNINLYAYVSNDPLNATDPSGTVQKETVVCSTPGHSCRKSKHADGGGFGGGIPLSWGMLNRSFSGVRTINDRRICAASGTCADGEKVTVIGARPMKGPMADMMPSIQPIDYRWEDKPFEELRRCIDYCTTQDPWASQSYDELKRFLGADGFQEIFEELFEYGLERALESRMFGKIVAQGAKTAGRAIMAWHLGIVLGCVSKCLYESGPSN